MNLLEFKVTDMACSACSDKITQVVKAIDPSATVTADLVSKLVNISSEQPEMTIKSAITTAGYTIA